MNVEFKVKANIEPEWVVAAMKAAAAQAPHKCGEPYGTDSLTSPCMGWPVRPGQLLAYDCWERIGFGEDGLDAEGVGRLWTVHDQCIWSADGHELVGRRVSAYFVWAGTKSDQDICGWCGYDNGPTGREGHDCILCGGN